jgi:hypothetical protein
MGKTGGQCLSSVLEALGTQIPLNKQTNKQTNKNALDNAEDPHHWSLIHSS